MRFNEGYNQVRFFYQNRFKRLTLKEDEKMMLLFSLLTFFKFITEGKKTQILESQISVEVEELEKLFLYGNREYFNEEIARIELRLDGRILYFSDFLTILKKIPPREIDNILNDWSSSFEDSSFYDNNNLVGLIEYIIFEWKPKIISETIGTRALSQFLNALIRPEKIENFLSLSLGLPTLLLDIKTSSFRDVVNVWGNEEESSSATIHRMIYYLLGIKKYNILNSDILDLILEEHLKVPQCDIIVTQASSKRRLSRYKLREINKILSTYLPIPVNDIVSVYLAFTLMKIKDSGRAYVLLPESFLFNEKSKYFRRFLIENGYVEAIFSLPYGVFTPTAAKTSLLILNKGGFSQNNGRSIFFGRIRNEKREDIPHYIDEILTSFYSNGEQKNISKVISKEKVHSNDDKLSAEQYIYKDYEQLEELDESYVQLQKLIKKKIQGNSSNMHLFEPCLLAQTKDLFASSTGEYFLDITKLKKSSTGSSRTILDKSAILISLVGTELKPTLYKHVRGANPLVLHSNVLALVPNENIDIEYLLFQLKSDLTKIQCFRIRYGVTAHKINRSDFMKIKIRVLSMEEQRIRAKEFKTLLFHQKKAEFHKFEKRLQLESLETEYNVVATIAHNLNQKLNTVENNFSIIRYVLENYQKEGIIDLSEQVNSSLKISLEEVVSKLGGGISNMSKTLMTVRRVLQKKKLNKKQVRPEVLKELLFNHVTPKNYDLEIKVDTIFRKKTEKINVDIDIDAFKEIINNFISNATRHGFKDNTKSNYKIIFEFSLYRDNDGNFWMKIDYKNDGKPFPQGFSFEEYKRFGGRAGENKNSGLGGFWINKVIELHGGKFNYLSENIVLDDEFNVIFEILLPIETIR